MKERAKTHIDTFTLTLKIIKMPQGPASHEAVTTRASHRLKSPLHQRLRRQSGPTADLAVTDTVGRLAGTLTANVEQSSS